MTSAKSSDEIPRGNTSYGVNRTIIEYLISLEDDFDGEYFLDIPCGKGDFLQAVKNYFPECKAVGADISSPPKEFPADFVQIDAQNAFRISAEKRFKVITCISGVMEFDNTLAFLERLKHSLDENGLLIVTNDNLLSVNDRLLYLLFGRIKQYRLFIGNNEPTWKIIPLQNLLRILDEAGFEPVEIKYSPFKAAQWLWLPVALLIFAFQFFYLKFAEKHVSFDEKIHRYPFSSLLSRHYVVICRVKN